MNEAEAQRKAVETSEENLLQKAFTERIKEVGVMSKQAPKRDNMLFTIQEIGWFTKSLRERNMRETEQFFRLAMRDSTLEMPKEPLMRVVKAPWTMEQVKALNDWQSNSNLPTFELSACANAKLKATKNGWRSPSTHKIVQTWARQFMFDENYRRRKRGGAVV